MFRALLDFQRRWTEAAVTVLPRPWGVLVRSERYPLVHMGSMALVHALPPEGPPRILADLDEALRGSDIRHRLVVFESALEAYESQDAFARDAFTPTADLALARLGLPSCVVNPDVDVRRIGEGASEDDFRAIARAIHEEAGYGREVHDQIYGLERERRAAVGMLDYVAYLEGERAGIVSLWPRGPFALLDNVATHPRFRMRGVGRTMIFEACEAAARERCEWALLTADLFDRPQTMYKSLGFEPIGEIRGFLRA